MSDLDIEKQSVEAWRGMAVPHGPGELEDHIREGLHTYWSYIRVLETTLSDRELCGICIYLGKHGICKLAAALPRREIQDPDDRGWPVWVQDDDALRPLLMAQASVRNFFNCQWTESRWQLCIPTVAPA